MIRYMEHLKHKWNNWDQEERRTHNGYWLNEEVGLIISSHEINEIIKEKYVNKVLVIEMKLNNIHHGL